MPRQKNPPPAEPRRPPPDRQGRGRAAEAGGGPERLQRALARAGIGSRRAAEELIRQGRVRIRGRVATLGDRADPAVDTISVDGVPVPAHPALRYFAFNKPRGVTTTLRDPHAEVPLSRFLPSGPRVFPVGRLDRESEGLVLLTNDGNLAYRLQHPSYGVEKEYLVEVDGELTRDAMRRLVQGIPLEDGMARAVRAELVQRVPRKSAASLVMNEGRKRELRRMLAALGYPVRRLVRTRLGPVRLGRLPAGRVRELTFDEVRKLYRVTRLDEASPRQRGRGRPRPKGDQSV